MGSLSDFNSKCKNIKQLKDTYDSSIFIETGCFRGNSLSFVIDMDFDYFFSCDIDQEMIDHCLKRFEGKNLDIFNMTSVEFLRHILPELNEVESIMFYLDAHLPEHDKNSGSVLIDTDLNFPLEEELSIINEYRSSNNDVIIIDDLRIYEDGNFEGGNWKERQRFNLNLDFINQYNFHVEKFYSQEGYLLLRK